MANKKISELTALGGTPANDDVVPVVDTSTSTTKKVTVSNLLSGKADSSHTHAISDVTNLQTSLDAKQAAPSEGAFANGDKTKLDGIEASSNNYSHPNHTGDVTSTGDGATVIANDAVTTDKINDSAVTTAKIADDAVTAAKLDAALNDLSNVNASPSDGQVLKWVDASGEWQADDDAVGTTYSDFTGATSEADGTAGLVPQPDSGDEGKYLKGDGTWDTVSGTGGGISNVSEDTTPQLGGNLDVDGNSIVSASNGNIAVTPNGTGKIILDGLNWPTADGSADQVLKTDGSGQLSFTDASSGGGISNVSEDTTPQLGGDLDVNGQAIVSTSNADIEIAPNGTGATVFKGNTNAGTITLNCENNSHGVSVASPAHADYSGSGSWTLTLPTSAGTNGQVLSTNGSGVASWTTLTTYAASGDNSDITSLSGLTGNLVFEGATDDDYETTLTVTDPTDDRTITFPDASGTVTLGTIGTEVQAYDADTTKNDVSNTWTAAQQGNTQTAAFSALSSGVLDFDTYQNFVITLGAGTNAFTNPTTDSGNTGQTGVIVLIQDSSASTATWASDYKNVGGSAPTLSSGSAKVDVLPYIIQADNTILLGAPQLDFS